MSQVMKLSINWKLSKHHYFHGNVRTEEGAFTPHTHINLNLDIAYLNGPHGVS